MEGYEQITKESRREREGPRNRPGISHRVQSALDGFWERQQARSAKRARILARSLASPLPLEMRLRTPRSTHG